MKCERIEELLPRFTEGDLPETDMVTVREHLSRCGRCRESHDRYAAIEDALRMRRKLVPSPQATSNAVINRLALARRGTGRRSLLGLPIIASLAAAACAVIYHSLPPSPGGLFGRIASVFTGALGTFSDRLPGWIVQAAGGEFWVLLAVYASLIALLTVTGTFMMRRIAHR